MILSTLARCKGGLNTKTGLTSYLTLFHGITVTNHSSLQILTASATIICRTDLFCDPFAVDS